VEMRGSHRRGESAWVVQTVHKCWYEISVHVRELQWEQSHMYVGCNENNCVCTRVQGRTIMYVGHVEQ
jgi:hypothetical protein